MKYHKPICECGEELRITEIITCDKLTQITSFGERSKKHIYSAESGDGEHLECIKCGANYDIEYDENKRIVRGEEYHPELR